MTFFAYTPPLSSLIRRYKHRHQLHLENPLVALWLDRLGSDFQRPDALVPVPCHWRRHWRRGFSPAARLARALGRELGVPVIQALERCQSTVPQQGAGRGARQRNLPGSMRARRELDDLHLALVDDVMTTGATAREGSRALRRAGANRVDIWALARTLDPR